jgi:hypothetical protein
LGQQVPTALQQVFSVGRQTKSTANVFKENDAELDLQCMDLP